MYQILIFLWKVWIRDIDRIFGRKRAVPTLLATYPMYRFASPCMRRRHGFTPLSRFTPRSLIVDYPKKTSGVHHHVAMRDSGTPAAIIRGSMYHVVRIKMSSRGDCLPHSNGERMSRNKNKCRMARHSLSPGHSTKLSSDRLSPSSHYS